MANEQDRELPKQVGNYTLLERLDSGTSSHAYLARDNQSGEYIVLSVLDDNGWGTYLSIAPEQLDGIITKQDDQSPTDYIMNELFPENNSQGLVISSQSEDVEFKEEQLEENLSPNITLPELIGVTSFKAIVNDSKESNDSKDFKKRYKPADVIVQTSSSSFTPPGDAFDVNMQSLAENTAGDLENIEISRETFEDLFLLLGELNYPVSKERKVNRFGIWCYDRVEVDRNKYWDLIYLPNEILTKPTRANLLMIGGLCLVFGKRSSLLVFHTAGEELDVQIEQIITIDWLETAEVTAKLVSLKKIKQIFGRDEDTRDKLAKDLFV